MQITGRKVTTLDYTGGGEVSEGKKADSSKGGALRVRAASVPGGKALRDATFGGGGGAAGADFGQLVISEAGRFET